MTHDIELQIRPIDSVPTHDLRANVGLLLYDETIQSLRVFDVVAPPVVIELKAREVLVSPIDLSRRREILVSVAAGAQGLENVEVGLQIDRDAQHLEPDPLENTGRLDIVEQLA